MSGISFKKNLFKKKPKLEKKPKLAALPSYIHVFQQDKKNPQ
jgi:hypothetical protein